MGVNLLDIIIAGLVMGGIYALKTGLINLTSGASTTMNRVNSPEGRGYPIWFEWVSGYEFLMITAMQALDE